MTSRLSLLGCGLFLECSLYFLGVMDFIPRVEMLILLRDPGTELVFSSVLQFHGLLHCGLFPLQCVRLQQREGEALLDCLTAQRNSCNPPPPSPSGPLASF
ncbi:hypothetical protein GDO81_004379 [Engystomops pustulosus]|uniref:Uncharacterized protein n=1 Tax=Engystomops pustulosus TaxID=76066 RepID=A0AAV6ZXL3_ENGPU|nr:hypothetical protein GDO81_004379 [Engystomops pustulosus]